MTVGDAGCMTFEYLHRHINPALVRAIGLLSDGLAAAQVFDFDPSALGVAPPAWVAKLSRVPIASVWPEPLKVDTRVVDGILTMDIRCRMDWVDPELVAEMNGEVLPEVCGAIVLAV